MTKNSLVKQSNINFVYDVIKNEANQVIVPTCKAYQKKTSIAETKKAIIGYLPAIADSPIRMNVTQAITDRSITSMHSLNQDLIFLKVDQAIYIKALQALFSHEQNINKNYASLIVRMDGFCVMICMLRPIYSRFKDSRHN